MAPEMLMKENPGDCRSNLKICQDLFWPQWLCLLLAIPPQLAGWGDKYIFRKSNIQALLKPGKAEPGRLKILIMYPGLPEKRRRCAAGVMQGENPLQRRVIRRWISLMCALDTTENLIHSECRPGFKGSSLKGKLQARRTCRDLIKLSLNSE